jgi:hypothetical protein
MRRRAFPTKEGSARDCVVLTNAPTCRAFAVNTLPETSLVRRFGTAITAVLGVIFFFAIIGVFGLPAAIASLALYIAVAVLLVLRAHP